MARTTTTAEVGYGDVKKGLFEAKIDTERETVIQAGDENNVVDEREVEGFRVQGRAVFLPMLWRRVC